MRALVLADRDPHRLDALIAAERPEAIVTLGDLDAWSLDALRGFDGPKLGVYGNHCDGVYMRDLGIINLHGRAGRLRGVRYGGLEGCIAYKPIGLHLYTEQQVDGILSDMPPVDVMVCHSPPRGINDEEGRAHRGFIALREYVERTCPQMLLHGHTAPRELVHRFGDTQIVYVKGHAMIDLPDRSRLAYDSQ